MKLRSFLVEDNALIRANMILALEELAEAEVVAVAAGETEARRWLLAHPDEWTLVVIDLFLAEGNGLGVLEACQGRDSARKAVVLSNYATAEMRRRCLALGADAVFDKSNELDAFFDYCSLLTRTA